MLGWQTNSAYNLSRLLQFYNKSKYWNRRRPSKTRPKWDGLCQAFRTSSRPPLTRTNLQRRPNLSASLHRPSTEWWVVGNTSRRVRRPCKQSRQRRINSLWNNPTIGKRQWPTTPGSWAAKKRLWTSTWDDRGQLPNSIWPRCKEDTTLWCTWVEMRGCCHFRWVQ